MSSLSDTNPLHFEVTEPVRWSRVNIAEAVPGVCTALGYSFWLVPHEIGIRRGYHAVGAMDRSEIVMPTAPKDFTFGVFYGQVAINLTVQTKPLSRVITYSIDMVESVMLGKGNDEAPDHVSAVPKTKNDSKTESFGVIARTIWCLWRLPSWQAALKRDIAPWWEHVTGAGKPTSADAAIREMRKANDLFLRVFSIHMTTGVLMGAVYAQLAKLAATAGHPGLETTLVTGYGGIDETRSLHLLWEVAHGRRDYQDFVREHGFHGSAEGELSTPSWREDPNLLKGIIEEMSRRDEDESPERVERRQVERRIAAERTLIAGLPSGQRAKAKLIIKLAKRLIPMRENSKACFLRTIDVARCAARVIGAEMAEKGVLLSPEDIYHLTYDEIVAGALSEDRAALQAHIAKRRRQRDEYLDLELPYDWTGMPEPLRAKSKQASRGETVAGIGVSPGIIEGRARVIESATGDVIMECGEILVCPMTDPSWASMLMLASGAVIDMGGPLSHGAVVARELGIPCIMNTVNGTKALRTGDLVRIDGTLGTVEILEASEIGEVA